MLHFPTHCGKDVKNVLTFFWSRFYVFNVILFSKKRKKQMGIIQTCTETRLNLSRWFAGKNYVGIIEADEVAIVLSLSFA